MDELTTKHCIPCEGGIPPLKGEELKPFLEQIDQAWQLAEDEKKIRREFTFKDFKEAVAFVNKLADLAESEGHHPDLHLYYNKLTVELMTHKIDGLFDNDFILAAKTDGLYKSL